jgi:hypothetical protein
MRCHVADHREHGIHHRNVRSDDLTDTSSNISEFFLGVCPVRNSAATMAVVTDVLSFSQVLQADFGTII